MTIRKRIARILRKAASKLDPLDFPYPHEMVNGVVDALARWDRERSRPNMVTHGPDGVIG